MIESIRLAVIDFKETTTMLWMVDDSLVISRQGEKYFFSLWDVFCF